MQVTETLNEGLKRKLGLTIPAKDLKSRQDAKLDDLKAKANIKGFRPGKVPVAHLKKIYGQSIMSEVMQEAINAAVQETLEERSEKAAAQPKVDMSEDQSDINNVFSGAADLTIDVSYEVLPAIELMDFKTIEIEKPVVPVSEEIVQRELDRLFLERREYEPKKDGAKVENGDKVGMSFEGKIEGEPFEGGASDHAHVVVGAGQYIPGFEEQLVGMKKGQKGDVKVSFPDDYSSPELAGKDAVFGVEILHIDTPTDAELDDEFAKNFGVEDVDGLKNAIREQIAASHESMSRQRVKRLILDAMDEGHNFDLPEQLVDNEFEGIWQRVMQEMEQAGKSFEDEDTTEDDARIQYRKIAERRVRLGLVVAEVGNLNNIEISEEEHQQALIAEVQRFPGKEQEVYDYYRKNPQALAGLPAPIFENKVVDYVAELAKTSEKEMERDDLARLIELIEDD